MSFAAENNSPKYRWLVTGGAGFIGSHIVERLLRDGHFVRVLDNFSSGKIENLAFTIETRDALRSTPYALRISDALHSTPYALRTDNFELVRGDIRDSSLCDFSCRDIDYVLHQAALRSVPKSLDIPHEFNAVNIDGSLNILEAALKNKVKRVVLASSSSIYGDAVSFPQKESDPPRLVSPYALTKLAVEHYSRVFSLTYGLETVNLRYFNVFGPKQALDDEYAVVIPKFIDCMLRDEQPPVHGDGKQSRDFTYIDNVVEANILSATFPSNRYPLTANRSLVFNVACGETHSILGLVGVLNKIMGKEIEPLFEPKRAGDVFKTLADITRICSVINFRPKVSFEEGMRRTVEWFSERMAVEASVQ